MNALQVDFSDAALLPGSPEPLGATWTGDGRIGLWRRSAKKHRTGTSVKLSSEQVSKVKTHFAEHRPNVKAVSKTEVSVSVGVAVPVMVVLYDLPPDIIVVEGGCPIKYFLWGDDIVLVDSCTRAVVEIIVIA